MSMKCFQLVYLVYLKNNIPLSHKRGNLIFFDMVKIKPTLCNHSCDVPHGQSNQLWPLTVFSKAEEIIVFLYYIEPLYFFS